MSLIRMRAPAPLSGGLITTEKIGPWRSAVRKKRIICVKELLGQMTAREHVVGTGAHLKHGLLQDEVLAPELCHILLDGAARRAEVIETRHAAIYLEGGNEEEPPLQHICLHARHSRVTLRIKMWREENCTSLRGSSAGH